MPQRLNERHSAATIAGALRFFARRTSSRPDTQAMAAEAKALRTEVLNAADNLDEAEENRAAATAEIEYFDSLLDEGVMDLSRDVLAAAKGDRESLLYRKGFPSAPSDAMKPVGTEAQSAYVQNLTVRLRTEPELAPWKARADDIEKADQALSESQKNRTKLSALESQASLDLTLTRDRAIRAYKLFQTRLALQFPDDPALVESFFKKLGKQKTKPKVA